MVFLLINKLSIALHFFCASKYHHTGFYFQRPLADSVHFPLVDLLLVQFYQHGSFSTHRFGFWLNDDRRVAERKILSSLFSSHQQRPTQWHHAEVEKSNLTRDSHVCRRCKWKKVSNSRMLRRIGAMFQSLVDGSTGKRGPKARV